MEPSKYSADVHRRIVDFIKDGATQRAAARMVGVTPETLSNWKSRYPEFGEDVERAHAEAQVYAETSLYRLARAGNVRALQAWLQTRRPEEWGKNATGDGGNGGPPVVIYLPDNGRGPKDLQVLPEPPPEVLNARKEHPAASSNDAVPCSEAGEDSAGLRAAEADRVLRARCLGHPLAPARGAAEPPLREVQSASPSPAPSASMTTRSP